MLRRLLNTAVFRVSLIYALLFSLIAAGALVSVYKVAEAQIRQQTDERLKLETNVLLNRYRTGAYEALSQTIRLRNSDEGTRLYIYALIHRQELDLTRIIPAENVNIISDDRTQSIASMPLGNVVEYVHSRHKDDKVRVVLTILPGGFQLLVGTDLDETQKLLNRLFQTTLIAISIIFALAILVGTIMGRKMMNSVNNVTRTADTIISGDLSQRMPITNHNHEIDRLSHSLNRMLDRIEQLMQGMREVTDNLAHDLRNPLNRVRNRLESVQFKNPDSTDFPQVIDETITDIDALIQTFNALLSIAQIESGVHRKKWQDININALLNDLGELYSVVAEDKSISWEQNFTDDLSLQGNKQLLAQLITNLLDNAVKYTPRGGHISLSAQWEDKTRQHLNIIIADNGPGIPAENYKDVFKRFHRLDNARSSEGNGLGLSLVKAVAELHEGEIQLADNDPGLKVTIRFPHT